MPVALRRRGLGRLARHRAGTRRHDDRRLGMARGDTAVNTFLIIRAVASQPVNQSTSQPANRAVGLVEQGTDLRAIIGILVGQHRRDDPPGAGIQAEVEVAVHALNRMLELGRPESVRIA